MAVPSSAEKRAEKTLAAHFAEVRQRLVELARTPVRPVTFAIPLFFRFRTPEVPPQVTLTAQARLEEEVFPAREARRERELPEASSPALPSPSPPASPPRIYRGGEKVLWMDIEGVVVGPFGEDTYHVRVGDQRVLVVAKGEELTPAT